jgi:hypothetical protein
MTGVRQVGIYPSRLSSVLVSVRMCQCVAHLTSNVVNAVCRPFPHFGERGGHGESSDGYDLPCVSLRTVYCGFDHVDF